MKKLFLLFVTVGLTVIALSCVDKQEELYADPSSVISGGGGGVANDSLDCVNKGCIYYQKVCACEEDRNIPAEEVTVKETK